MKKEKHRVLRKIWQRFWNNQTGNLKIAIIEMLKTVMANIDNMQNKDVSHKQEITECVTCRDSWWEMLEEVLFDGKWQQMEIGISRNSSFGNGKYTCE